MYFLIQIVMIISAFITKDIRLLGIAGLYAIAGSIYMASVRIIRVLKGSERGE